MECTGLQKQTFALLLVCIVGLSFVQVVDGNIKAANGSITWDSLPPEPKYNTSTEEPNLTFDLVFIVASEFIHAVAPSEFPWELLRGVINGTVDPLRDYKDFVSYSVGFIVCFALALLFVVAMPIAGLIFCLCRCCENCGGKMLQRDKYNTTCRRVSFGLVLLFITALMTLGLAGVVMANSQMSTSVHEIKITINTNLEDFSAYIKHTFKEFYFLVIQQFGFVSSLILKDLFQIDKLVGNPVRDNLARRVDPALASVYRLGRESQGLQANLMTVNQSANELKERGARLQEALDMARHDINVTLQSIECQPNQPCPKEDVDLNQVDTAADFRIIDIETELNRVNEALKTNITEKANQGQQELDNIPNKVKNESHDVIEEFKKELESLPTIVKQELDAINSTLSPDVQKFLDMFSLDSMSPQARQMYEILDFVEMIDRYRFYVGIALVCIIFIIVLCNFLGMMFGECGRDKREKPTERGCLSNFGGTLLLAGVAISFIFAFFIMILTTLCFLLGGVSEKVICEPLTTKSIFNEVIDYPYLIDSSSQYWLSDNLFGKGAEPLTAKSLIISCEINEGLYRALRLANIYNITAALDYRKNNPGIDTKLDGINLDLSNVVILESETKTALRNFVDSGVADVNYTEYLQEIRKGVTQVDLEGLASQLEGYAQDPLPNTTRTRLIQHAMSLRNIQNTSVDPMESYVNSLEVNLDALLAKATNLRPLVNESLTNIEETQDFIHNTGPKLFRTAVEYYVDGILSYVDQYVLYVLSQVNNEVGGCKPIANLYDSLEILICKNLVYSFNGFWLCLGWCVLLFIPSIIFAVKLSKFYRRMHFYEDCFNAHDMERIPMKHYERD